MPVDSHSFEKLDAHARMVERDAWREDNARKDKEASAARFAKRERVTCDDRVAAAVKKLQGMNAGVTINFMRSLSSRELDFYLIAESVSANRKSVLQAFPPPRKSVVLAFYGTETPDQSPEKEQPERSEPETAED